MICKISGIPRIVYLPFLPRKLLLIAVAALVAFSACREEAGHQAPVSAISFSDPNMKACVESAGVEFVDEVIALNCLGFDIFDLTGIENFPNLRTANFRFNRLGPRPDGSGGFVPALAPMSTLALLEYINVAGNRGLKDASPIGGLSSLVSLNMGETSLDDIGLAGLNTGLLTSLQLLDLFETDLITDVSPVASLTTLKHLNFGNDPGSGTAGIITTGVPALSTLVNAEFIIFDGQPLALCADINTLRAALPTTNVLHPGCP